MPCDTWVKRSHQRITKEKGKTMNTLSHSQANKPGNDGGHFLALWVRAHLAQITESFWFCLSFLLFLIMGPFSAIVVLIGLGSLASEENRQRMSEPAQL
jgi:hypothetical protein